MPDIEMLQLLGKTFNVSINELLAGKTLTDGEFRKKADENVIDVSKEGSFSFCEKKAFWKKKWRKDHRSLIAICAVITLVIIKVN